MSELGMFSGVRVTVVPTWVSGYAWRHLGRAPRVPSKRDGRTLTRRQWKRKHPFGIRYRYGPVEPDHVLQTPQGIFCTARQADAIRRATTPKDTPNDQ